MFSYSLLNVNEIVQTILNHFFFHKSSEVISVSIDLRLAVRGPISLDTYIAQIIVSVVRDDLGQWNTVLATPSGVH